MVNDKTGQSCHQEELAFKSQLHQSELNETRTRMEISMEEVDSKVQREYEHKLQEALADFRHQHETEMRHYRDDLEVMYEGKVRARPQLAECAVSDYDDTQSREC